MGVVKPKYPDILTVAFWTKAKKAVDANGATGITPQLTSAASAFEAAPWDKLDAAELLRKLVVERDDNLKLSDLTTLATSYVNDNMPIFLALEKKFKELATFLNNKAVEITNTEPKLANVVKSMGGIAETFSGMVRWINVSQHEQQLFFKAIENQKERERLYAESLVKLKTVIHDAKLAVAQAEKKTMTVESYHHLWSNNLRGIGAAVKLAKPGHPGLEEKFHAPMEIAAKLWNQDHLPKSAELIQPRLKHDLELVIKFEHVAAQLD